MCISERNIQELFIIVNLIVQTKTVVLNNSSVEKLIRNCLEDKMCGLQPHTKESLVRNHQQVILCTK